MVAITIEEVDVRLSVDQTLATLANLTYSSQKRLFAAEHLLDLILSPKINFSDILHHPQLPVVYDLLNQKSGSKLQMLGRLLTTAIEDRSDPIDQQPYIVAVDRLNRIVTALPIQPRIIALNLTDTDPENLYLLDNFAVSLSVEPIWEIRLGNRKDDATALSRFPTYCRIELAYHNEANLLAQTLLECGLKNVRIRDPKSPVDMESPPIVLIDYQDICSLTEEATVAIERMYNRPSIANTCDKPRHTCLSSLQA